MTVSHTPMLNKYCEEHTSQPSEELYHIYRSIALHMAYPHKSSTPYQGQLLRMLTLIKRPLLAVEVGSFGGYGTVCLAQGMPPEAKLHVIEIDEELESMILDHCHQAGVTDKVLLHIGNALEVIPTLPHGIDLAFIDADKENYENYYQLLIPMMNPGGILIFDNMLWYGRVMEEPETQLRCDRATRTIQHLNDLITADPRVDNILLPIRDGLMLCRVK